MGGVHPPPQEMLSCLAKLCSLLGHLGAEARGQILGLGWGGGQGCAGRGSTLFSGCAQPEQQKSPLTALPTTPNRLCYRS